MNLVPVDNDPFAQANIAPGPKLVPVDHDPFAANPASISPALDAANQATIGLSRGALNAAGQIPDFASWLRSGANKGFDWLLGQAPPNQPDLSNTLGSAGLNQAAAKAIPGLTQAPQTSLGQYARTAGEFVPGALLAPGNPLVNALRYGVGPGIASEAAGQATAGTPIEGPARIAAALGGGLVGGSVLTGAKSAAAEAIPTAENIGSLKNAAYDQAKELGAAYTPEAYGGLIAKIQADAKASDLNPELAPKANSFIKNMGNIPEHGGIENPTEVSLTALDQKRQALNRDVMSSKDDSERFFGQQIKNNIDQFIANPGENAMASGAAPAAADAIQNARDLNTRYEKSQALAEALKDAGLRANRNQVYNIDATTRQNLYGLLKNENWTPQEASQIESTMGGSALQNVLRGIGKFSPGAGFLPSTLELMTAGSGHQWPAIAMAAGGMGAKAASAAMTNRNVQNLMQTILAGGRPSPLQVNPQPWQLGAALAGISSRNNLPAAQSPQ